MLAVIIQFWRHVLQSQDSKVDSGQTTDIAIRNPTLLPTIEKLDCSKNTGHSKTIVLYWFSHMVGDDDGEVPPVPIPNTVVKLTRAQDS